MKQLDYRVEELSLQSPAANSELLRKRIGNAYRIDWPLREECAVTSTRIDLDEASSSATN